MDTTPVVKSTGFFDIKVSDILKTGADAFVASEAAKTAEENRITQQAKTSEVTILAQAQAAGNQAVMYAKENQKTLLIIVAVIGLGFMAMKSKGAK